jgi:hypothetical protein
MVEKVANKDQQIDKSLKKTLNAYLVNQKKRKRMRIRKVNNKKIYRAWVTDHDRQMAEKLHIPFTEYVKRYVELTIKEREEKK